MTTTQVSKKVRLVRCPGCRNVLAELPEVSLYKCGGCGTILQAKNRKLETNNTELSSREPDSVAKSHQDNALGQEEARSSNQDENDNFRGICQERSISDGLSSSPDVITPPVEVKESLEHKPLDQNPEGYQSKFDGDDGERSMGPTFSDELPSSGEITLEDEAYNNLDASVHLEPQNHTDLHQDNKVDQIEEEIQNSPRQEDQESVLPERIKANYVPPENDSCSADQSGEFDGGIEHGGFSHANDVAPPSAEQVDDGSERTRREKNESLVSFYLTSDDENLDHSQSEAALNLERLSSIDTLGSSHLADLSSELNYRHTPLSTYPINGSYYAYDGSESSYDGTDDQIIRHTSHPSRKNNMLRKDGLRRDDMVKSEPERPYRATGSSHCAMRSSHLSRGTATEASRYNAGHRMRIEEQGDVFGLPFTSRDRVTGHRIVRTPGYQRNSLPPRPGVNLPNKPSYSEPDKIDLLRTVCELKDQLNRMHFAPFHYDHLASNRDIYADRSDPSGYNPQHYHAEGCAKRCNVSRLAFSGEAAHYRHQASCSCLHCCPQDWHYSVQLPSRNCCNISNAPSPHRYTSSEPSIWGCETKSDNQRLGERKRIHLREKYHTAKRHLRPVAGGAPVVACYHCWELLQLPADFLLFKRRYHRLMCNACQKVLKFSVLRGTHIVPYVNDASAPPPSEADDFSEAPRQRNLEPVSYSDDYGQSLGRSCSTEGEASVVLPSVDQVDTKSYNRKMSSGSSFKPMEDRKMKGIMKEPQSENESLPNSVGSVGPSSKMPVWRKSTSEIEEVFPSSNSPLHQLMGYKSPGQVLNR